MKRQTTIATKPKPKCFHHSRRNGVKRLAGSWFCGECLLKLAAAESRRPLKS
jgi:hypothetical protein